MDRAAALTGLIADKLGGAVDRDDRIITIGIQTRAGVGLVVLKSTACDRDLGAVVDIQAAAGSRVIGFRYVVPEYAVRESRCKARPTERLRIIPERQTCSCAGLAVIGILYNQTVADKITETRRYTTGATVTVKGDVVQCQ